MRRILSGDARIQPSLSPGVRIFEKLPSDMTWLAPSAGAPAMVVAAAAAAPVPDASASLVYWRRLHVRVWGVWSGYLGQQGSRKDTVRQAQGRGMSLSEC